MEIIGSYFHYKEGPLHQRIIHETNYKMAAGVQSDKLNDENEKDYPVMSQFKNELDQESILYIWGDKYNLCEGDTDNNNLKSGFKKLKPETQIIRLAYTQINKIGEIFYLFILCWEKIVMIETF